LAQGLAAHAEAGVGGGQNRRRRLNCQKLAPRVALFGGWDAHRAIGTVLPVGSRRA